MKRGLHLLTAKVVGIFSIALAMIVIGSSFSYSQAQKPELPRISLTGLAAGWSTTIYPDGRIWVPRAVDGGHRELLVPVFVRNCWRTTSTYEAFPIYSFKIKVQFDSSALEFMGIEKNGPARTAQQVTGTCLAKDFEFSTHVARDLTYQGVISAPQANRERGKRVLITGVSAKPLPQTGNPDAECDQRPFVEMFYMRFKVTADPMRFAESALTPLILTNDTLWYNDFKVGFELAFPDDPAPNQYTGLGGVDNHFFDVNGVEQCRDVPRYSRFGMIWVHVTDEIPRLSFTNVADRSLRVADSVDFTNNAQWYVVNPITMDSGATNFRDEVGGIGTRDMNLINFTPGSRLTDMVIQSDQPWLLFKTFALGGAGEENPIPQFVREGFVPMIDNGILGTTAGVTPLGEPTILRRDINFRVACDAGGLPRDGNSGEVAGIYVGHITFESASMDVSPVRLKVTFIYFRPPFEPNEFDDAGNWKRGPSRATRGVTLEVRNSNQPIERAYLVMGVGARATDYADTLFGETVHRGALAGFGARWYPMDKDGQDIYDNGLGDLWQVVTGAQSNSRDIRDIYSDTTLIYKCRFNAGSPLNYPVVVTWDTSDFTPESSMFIRDTLAGSRFNVDMRKGTNVGGDKYSYTIQDADINAFIIEYTLPTVVQFPVIRKGWNLLSLPVAPSSSYWKDVYKRALNIPIRFSQNIYQASESTLQPGHGYFVKYADDVDTKMAGTRVLRINQDNHRTLVYDGWNTIGSLSLPISVEKVRIVPTSQALTEREGDIYRYVTDRGYQAVTHIEPGIGYWLKIRGRGILVMEASMNKTSAATTDNKHSILNSSTTVNIVDAASNSFELYIYESGKMEQISSFELPPLPPAGLFDVRFGNSAYVEDALNPVIQLQGASYPVSIAVNNPSRSYRVVDAVTGDFIGSVAAGTHNIVRIAGTKGGAVRLMSEDALSAGIAVKVTPNPVNSTGLVKYTLPATGSANVSIFNLMGNKVAELVNENRQAGIYSVDLNTAQLPAGQYIVKVISGESIATTVLTVVR